MFKRILAALLCAVMLIPAAACTQAPADTASIVITDQAGRNVALDEPAEKVVSCYYISTYAMLSLGLRDSIVGLEKKANTRPVYQMAAPELLEKPAVGTMKELNVEAVAALEPDLVIMPLKLADYAETLASLGIPTLMVNPENHEDLCEMLTLIGQACGAEDKAEALIKYYDKQLKAVAKYTKKSTKPTVYMGGNSSYLTAAPSGMYQGSLIETAGGINAAASLEGDYWTEVSYESILAMNPDVIIIPAGAAYTKDDLLADKELASVKAIKNKQVYAMPSGLEEWDSPIPSGILGVLWLTSVLNADSYSFADFTGDVQDFYSTFYGVNVDAALITK